jgi:hypothetical protein
MMMMMMWGIEDWFEQGSNSDLTIALSFHSYNGYLPAGERGRRRSKFVLYRRPQANGVRRSKHYVVKTPHSSKAILDASQHSISYTLSRSQAVIVEYTEDPDTDMFQVSHFPFQMFHNADFIWSIMILYLWV